MTRNCFLVDNDGLGPKIDQFTPNLLF
jgi:hypothetical protein